MEQRIDTQLSILATSALTRDGEEDENKSFVKRGATSSADAAAYLDTSVSFAFGRPPTTTSSATLRKSPLKTSTRKNVSGLNHVKPGVVRGTLRGNYKKSHSSMDLVNYERLVDDDSAAGTCIFVIP